MCSMWPSHSHKNRCCRGDEEYERTNCFSTRFVRTCWRWRWVDRSHAKHDCQRPMRDVSTRVRAVSSNRRLFTVHRLDDSSETYCRSCALAHKATQRTSNDSRYRSAKIRQILKLLVKIEKTPDAGKTIIFSDFVKMLDIVARVLEEERIRFVRCKWLIMEY